MLLARVLYWTMPLVLLAWAAAGAWPRGTRGDLLRTVVAAALTGLVFTLLPPAMRMQFDETSLCGTAQNMHQHRVAMMSMCGVPDGTGGVQVLDWNLDKRPPLFSFLVSLLHDLTGYRLANAFVLNGALLTAFLAVLGGAVARARGGLAGLAAMLCALQAPMLWHCATSAGFELLALLLLLLTGLAARAFVQRPEGATGARLATTLLVLCYTRYEGLVLALLVLAAVAVARRSLGWLPRLGGWGVLALVLLAPLGWLLRHGMDAGFFLEAQGQPLVAFGAVTARMPAFARSFPWAVGGLLALLGLLVWPAARAKLRGVGWFAGLALSHTALVLVWFYGDPAEPTALRLFLPIAVLGGCAPLLLLCLPGSWHAPRWLVGVAVVLLGWRAGTLPGVGVLPPTLAVRALAGLDDALHQVQPDPRTTVVVSVAAQYLLLRDIPAVMPRALHSRGIGKATTILFATTALDEQLAPWFGEMAPLIAQYRPERVAAATGPEPACVYRIQR